MLVPPPGRLRGACAACFGVAAGEATHVVEVVPRQTARFVHSICLSQAHPS